MRKYRRSIAHADMERQGIRRINKRRGMRDKGRSLFAMHWLDVLKEGK